MARRGRIIRICLASIAGISLFGCCSTLMRDSGRWHDKYAYVDAIPPITFHCDHGVLAGSYPGKQETTQVRFADVCAGLGHVCLCGAGGYKIAELAVETIRGDGEPLERGDFLLISSKDHTVGDVIALVLGCNRRADVGRNCYFIDESIRPPKREYHYYIGHPPDKAAVQVVYRKNLLLGNEEMDRLWRIECAFEEDRDSVDTAEIELYRGAMESIVRDVLFEHVDGLITARAIPYDEFQARLDAASRAQSAAR